MVTYTTFWVKPLLGTLKRVRRVEMANIYNRKVFTNEERHVKFCGRCKTTENLVKKGTRINIDGGKTVYYICNPCNTKRLSKRNKGYARKQIL